jgi:hypothetical protein
MDLSQLKRAVDAAIRNGVPLDSQVTTKTVSKGMGLSTGRLVSTDYSANAGPIRLSALVLNTSNDPDDFDDDAPITERDPKPMSPQSTMPPPPEDDK